MERTANTLKSGALFGFTHLSVQEAVQDGDNKTLQEIRAVRRGAGQKAQLGKCSEYFSMNNDGKIMTNFRLRRAVHHVHVWDLFPGEITPSQNG